MLLEGVHVLPVIYGETRNAASLTCGTLVRSCPLVDAFEGIAQVIGEGVGGGDGVQAGLISVVR